MSALEIEPVSVPGLHPAPTRHARLVAWVEQIAALTRPDRVHWCDGSEAEKAAIVADLIDKGTLKALQSVGQIIGEVLKQLDEERCELRDRLSRREPPPAISPCPLRAMCCCAHASHDRLPRPTALLGPRPRRCSLRVGASV